MTTKTYWKAISLGMMAMLTAAGMTSCSGDNDDVEPVNPDGPKPEAYHPITADTRTLIEVTDISTIDPTELGEIIGNWPMLSYGDEEMVSLMKPVLKAAVRTRLPKMDKLFKERVGTAEDGSRQWNLRRYVFTYKSVSSMTGNDTTLVGTVVFPTNTLGQPHELDALTLYHHQAYFSKSWLASESLTLMAMHTLHNTAVIEPDGQGITQGEGVQVMENLIKNNLQGDLTALQMADCILAALEVMRAQGVTLAADGYSNNWGTSLGSVGVIGFAQYMERDATKDFQQLVKLRASYMGEGPTSLDQVNGFSYVWENPPVQKYQKGWNPSLPFYMSCNPNDELINYEKLKNFYNLLRIMPDGSINENVHWLDLNIPHTFIEKKLDSETPNHLLTAVATLIEVSLVEDPEDMAKLAVQNDLKSRYSYNSEEKE